MTYPMMPYGPQAGRPAFPAPGGSPGGAGDLQALLGSPALMAMMQQQQAAPAAPAAAPSLATAKPEGGPIVDPARPMQAPAEAASSPFAGAVANAMRGPLSAGSFPVRMRPGSAPGAPAAPFPSSAMFRAKRGY